MRLALIAWLFCTLSGAPAVASDLASSSPGAFVIHAERTVAATPDHVWAGLIHIGSWWDSAHTYSGAARNLTLDVRAGGCWCERWRGNSVKHAQVLMVMERDGVRTLRLEAPLGPLQAMAVNAVLTFTISPHPGGAKIEMTYRVSGDASLGLNQVGAGVNAIIGEQFERLVRLVTSGAPG